MKKQQERERINLSFSAKSSDDNKIIMLKKHNIEIKVSDRQCLSGAKLLKHLLLIGIEVLEKQYGEINQKIEIRTPQGKLRKIK